MRLVISHISSIGLCSRLAASGMKLAKPCQMRSLKDCLSSERDFMKCDLSFMPSRPELPLDILVSSSSRRCTTKNLIRHSWTGSLPKGAFYQLTDEVYVTSPELSLLLISKSLPFNELILLCSEACGTYAQDTSERGFYDRPPLTTIAKIAAFADKAGSSSGVSKLKRALSYTVENARSPMEAAVGILLGMPVRLGGFGLPRPLLNHRVDLSLEGARMAHRPYVVLDYFFPERNVAIEYDSDRYHLGASKMTSDAQRNNTLRYLDVSVINLTWEQVRDPQRLEDFATQVAHALGRQLRQPSATGRANRSRLRADVLPRLAERV